MAYKHKPLKEAFSDFKEHWENGAFGGTSEEYIMYSADVMISKKAKPVPDYYSFLKALNSFVDNKIDESSLQEYCLVLDTMASLKTSKTKQLNFHKFVAKFNKCKCFTSKGSTWSGDIANYRLGMAKSPYLEVSNFTLKLGSRKDTVSIQNTGGRYSIFSKTWRGKDGRVTWERSGFSPSSVYADLSNYTINMALIEYKADSVTFHNGEELDRDIMGTLRDRLYTSGGENPFPEFRSYQSSFKLNNLEDYIEYEGGFGMAGASILGSGSDSALAQMWIKRDGQKFLKLRSTSFVIKPQDVKCELAEVTFKLAGYDSIYHAGLYANIDRMKGVVTLSINPETKAKSPFFNSYHGVSMYVDRIDWNLDSVFMDIRSAFDPDGTAFFESENFYSLRRFDAIRGNLRYHPLMRLEDISNHYHTRVLTEDDLMGQFGVEKIELLQPLLAALHAEGYILYNVQKKEVTLNDKLFNYIAAFRKETDYDVIQLTSKAKDRQNSRLFFENFNLEINGVKRIKLSDSQAVEIFPFEQKVVLKQDRDMDFDGYVKAGRFEFFGSDFKFDYEDFTIALNSTDSMMFNFPDKRLDNRLRKVNTVVQDVTGILKIDKPDNKSGVKKAPDYPIFDCTDEAFVYYDYPIVYGGVYDRERFSFKLKPFVVDSLDNFSLFGISLDGTFKSANILPTFDYKLSLQEDFSLGFQTETPPEGYPLYKGAGQCFMKIFLSNQGLEGEGNFTFNGADVQSKSMIFFPDSMIAQNTTFIMKDHPKKKFPDVTSEKALVTWSPYQDTMIIAALDSASYINMYEKESFLKGYLTFTKKNMYGSGNFNYKHSNVSSDYFDFKYRKLNADSTKFVLYDLEGEREVMSNTSSKVNIDFDKQMLKGTSNSDTVFTELPVNQYTTNVPRYRWDYNEKLLYLEPDPNNEEDIDYFFVSTNPNYDSLKFTPQEAKLSLETYSIEVYNIKYIAVADAQVKPDSSITIGEDGGLPMLKNAEIMASIDNEFHVIKKAEVNIFSSKKLSAFGFYQYTDGDGKLWEIDMKEIRTTDTLTTVGIGKIPDSANFYFGPRMKYSGDVQFLSTRKPLEFNGELTVEHPFEEDLATEKLRYDGLVAFDSLYLDMSEPKNVYGEDLVSGVFMNTRTKSLYHRFLGKKANPDDWPIFDASGYLYYESDSNSFVITSYDRIFNDDLKGSIWTYNVGDSAVVADGAVGFDYEFDNFDLYLSGLLNHDIKTGETEFLATGGITFPFATDAVKVMGDSLVNFAYFNEDITNDKDYIVSGSLRHLESEKDVQRAVNRILNNNEIFTTKEYRPNFHISEMKLVWDTASTSFINEGQIALANIGSAPVNKMINARIVFSKHQGHDSIGVYLESNAGNWYLFNFDDNILEFGASDKEFIDRATASKIKDIEGEYKMKLADEFTIADTRQKIKR